MKQVGLNLARFISVSIKHPSNLLGTEMTTQAPTLPASDMAADLIRRLPSLYNRLSLANSLLPSWA